MSRPLQKFPFLFDKILSLPDRTYAVIVDEAHSSQTGEAAKELRRILGTAEVDIEDDATDAETLLAVAVAARGRQPNLSFFAFTATPKGRHAWSCSAIKGPDGKHHPFHLYPMRQAIEEGFIEDVLANYITYNRYLPSWRRRSSKTPDTKLTRLGQRWPVSSPCMM